MVAVFPFYGLKTSRNWVNLSRSLGHTRCDQMSALGWAGLGVALGRPPCGPSTNTSNLRPPPWGILEWLAAGHDLVHPCMDGPQSRL